jgi:hypothetical protein
MNAIKCAMCDFTCLYAEELLRHVYLTHSTDFNFQYECGENLCFGIFKCYRKLYNHMVRIHADQWQKRKLELSNANDILCSMCDFKCKSFKHFKNHFINHTNDRGLITCFVDGCVFVSDKPKYFQTHFRRKHTISKNVVSDFSLSNNNFYEFIEEQDNNIVDSDEVGTDFQEETHELSDLLVYMQPEDSSREKYYNFYLQMYIKYRDRFKIPETTLISQMNDIVHILDLQTQVFFDELLKAGQKEVILGLKKHQYYKDAHLYYSNKNNIERDLLKSKYYVEPVEIKLKEKDVYQN